jgi:hypothetical protein
MREVSFEEEDACIQVALYLSLGDSVSPLGFMNEEILLAQKVIIESITVEQERKNKEEKEIQEYYEKLLAQKSYSWEANEEEYEIIILDDETDNQEEETL